jgi:hypothetical protein
MVVGPARGLAVNGDEIAPALDLARDLIDGSLTYCSGLLEVRRGGIRTNCGTELPGCWRWPLKAREDGYVRHNANVNPGASRRR